VAEGTNRRLHGSFTLTSRPTCKVSHSENKFEENQDKMEKVECTNRRIGGIKSRSNLRQHSKANSAWLGSGEHHFASFIKSCSWRSNRFVISACMRISFIMSTGLEAALISACNWRRLTDPVLSLSIIEHTSSTV